MVYQQSTERCMRSIGIFVLCFFSFLIILPQSIAVADLEVVAFSCSPDEVALNDQFSCTATIQNTGDAAGNLGTATLYPDSTSWLEDSNYLETINTNVNSGATVEVVFDSLKGKKTGANGFSKIMIGEVTDTYVADNSIEVNVINLLLLVNSSATSGSSSSTVRVTAQTTTGGNADITMTFSVTAGDCSIGSQLSSVTTNNTQDGQTVSHTWTVTLGTANCSYTVTAEAQSNPDGSASKSDAASGTITLSSSDSDDDDSSPGSTSSGGGSGGGFQTTKNTTIACADGIDNDNDTLIDLKDPGCESNLDIDETDKKICTQSWACNDWDECFEGRQTRTCTESNDCLTKKTEGLVDQVIEITPPDEKQPCLWVETTNESQEIKPQNATGKIKGVASDVKELATGEEAPAFWTVLLAVFVFVGLGIYIYLYIFAKEWKK
ncbi:hypothetical protein HYW21_02715 [Candidatus Woesearchaeota archaeon]|nr:hypothetical protein [Candidatus Woesearchaeota archaeon]